MACHIRIASENSKFGQPEVNLGLIPGYGGTQRLVQLIGKGKALEMMLTGETINAQEALTLGLVTKVVPIDQLIQVSKEFIDKLTGKSPTALSRVIRCVNEHFKDTSNGFDIEISEFGSAFGTSEFKEGTTAFLEKRKPNY